MYGFLFEGYKSSIKYTSTYVHTYTHTYVHTALNQQNPEALKPKPEALSPKRSSSKPQHPYSEPRDPDAYLLGSAHGHSSALHELRQAGLTLECRVYKDSKLP